MIKMKLVSVWVCCLLPLLFSACPAFSRINSVINHYSTADGLSDNRLYCMVKDSEGFMWFGTWSGLNRFDGRSFISFKSKPGDKSVLENDRIVQIVDDKKGFLWIRSHDNYVYRFDKRKQRFENLAEIIHKPDAQKIPFNKILLVDDGHVWLQSEHHGIFLIIESEQDKTQGINFAAGATPMHKLPSDEIISFRIDDRHNAWVGTDKGVCTLVNEGNDKYKAQLFGELTGFVCQYILADEQRIWFGSANGYLDSYDYKTGRFNKNKISTDGINCISRSLKGDKIYCTTVSGNLVSFSIESKELKSYTVTPDSALYSIYEDRKGALWLEPGSTGVARLDPATGKSKHFKQENITAHYQGAQDYKVYEDNRGIVWACLRREGFGYYDSDKDAFAYFQNDPRNPYRKFSNIITASYYDTPDILWLSSYDGGIEKIVFQQNDFRQNFVVENSLYKKDNEVRGILNDRKNRLWVGTKAGQLLVLQNGKNLSNSLFVNQPPAWPAIYTIMEDKQGRIWMGTKTDGLFMAEPLNTAQDKYLLHQYTKEKNNPASVNTDVVYTLLQTSDGRIWAGSYGDGLILIDAEKEQVSFKTISNSFKNYPSEDYSKIRHLQEDKNGMIWIGTTQGLLIFDPAKGTPDNYTFSKYRKIPGDISSLGGNDINYIYRDAEDAMWLCTSSGGLNKAITTDPLKSIIFENYSTKNGLPSDYILDCIEDNKKNLWMATQNGVSKFSLKDKKFLNFGAYDGLPLSAFEESSCTRLNNGDIIFGSSLGYWSFNPNEIGTQKIKASLAFTNLQVNNEDVVPDTNAPLQNTINQTSELVLHYDQNIIKIDYIVLDYQSGTDDNYLYRLSGFDDNWRVNKGPGSATYTNLPPGSYTFEVKAQTEQRFTSKLYRSLRIRILPPPWKTWWAYTLYVLAAVAILFIIARVAFTMLKLRQRIVIEKRVADLKMNFFTQVSHELRTPLTLIVNPSEEILQHEKLTVEGAEQMNVVLKNARRMVRLVNQLLDLRKVQSGKATLRVSEVEIVSFVSGIIDYFKDSIHNKQLDVKLVSACPSLGVWIDAEKIDIVIYNLLANAIKFSDEHGKIDIVIAPNESSNTFTIEIKDEGRGVPQAELSEIFKLYYEVGNYADKPAKGTGIGLALSKELVALHEGEIYAENNQPHGLKVVVALKLGKAHYAPLHATFVNLPVQHKQQAHNQLATYTESTADSVALPLVLLVEDNDDLRGFLANKLKQQYRVETAKDGQEGLLKVQAILPDLVLSDIMMPRMDGIQLLDNIKSNTETSHIPVILLTARFSVESQIEGLQYGADYYITKPFQMDLLQSAMKNLILQRKKIFESILAGRNVEPVIWEEPDVAVIDDYGAAVSVEKEVKAPAITTHDKEFLKNIVRIVEEKLEDPDFNIDDVAESVIMSRSAFFKKFKSLTNMAPVEFVRETRLRKAQSLFDAGETNITEVAFAVGFNNPKYFSTCFRAQFGKSPSVYVKEIK